MDRGLGTVRWVRDRGPGDGAAISQPCRSESPAPGATLHDVNVNAEIRGILDEILAVTAVDRTMRMPGWAASTWSTWWVPGRGDQHREQEAEHVGHDAALLVPTVH